MSGSGADGGDRQRAAASGERGLIYRFGDCTLDARTLELAVRGDTVRLEPKPLDLLVYLLRHAGEVVTKDELQDGVWPGRVLSESVLTKTMAKLRQGLADEDQQIIRTVHGFGYRVVAPVTIETVGPVQTAPRLDLKAGDAPPLRPHWRLLESLGGGGFGDVWLAEQTKTGERRVFKFGLDARGLAGLKREITLFRVLRETHGERADFARLLDWNLEEPPYFVESEYANGGSLVQWAETSGGLGQVPRGQRIELITQAAEALAAAHAAGVLHKDLKPSNLLVHVDDSGSSQIKLADFGSGRVVDLARIEQLEITRMGFTQTQAASDSTSGTPFYFAPELLAGQQPTAQTDIYALGVILYQVLVGDLSRPLAPGWERDVDDELLREDIADAAAGGAAQRLTDAAELARRLRTLDARRAECLRERAEAGERDRARAEAGALRHELDRARLRRRWATGVAAMFAAASIVTAALLLQVRAARDTAQAAGTRAEREASVARAVNAFLVEDLLGQANPLRSGANDLSVRELLDAAAAEATTRFDGRPEQESAIRLAIAQAYTGLGLLDQAQEQIELTLAIDAATPSIRESARLAQAQLYVTRDQAEAASALLNELTVSADIHVRLRARLLQATIDFYAWRFDTALAAVDAVKPELLALMGEMSPDYARVTGLRAEVLRQLQRFDEALAEGKAALDVLNRLYGEADVRTLPGLTAVGTVLAEAERLDEARGFMERRHAIAARVLGAEHDETLRAASDLAYVYSGLGEYDRALALQEPTLDARLRLFGEAHDRTRNVMTFYAMTLDQAGRTAEALPWAERVYEVERRTVGETAMDTLIDATNLAKYYYKLDRHQESAALMRKTLAGMQQVAVDDNTIAIAQLFLARPLWALGDREEAGQLLDQAIATLRRTAGDDDSWTRDAIEQRELWRAATSDPGTAS
jgi:DNA-binding winged helix-turn-helix (wHTH) protein/tetratricopeptide (TPR) repeat protein